jgi:hypothetical protein
VGRSETCRAETNYLLCRHMMPDCVNHLSFRSSNTELFVCSVLTRLQTTGANAYIKYSVLTWQLVTSDLETDPERNNYS